MLPRPPAPQGLPGPGLGVLSATLSPPPWPGSRDVAPTSHQGKLRRLQSRVQILHRWIRHICPVSSPLEFPSPTPPPTPIPSSHIVLKERGRLVSSSSLRRERTPLSCNCLAIFPHSLLPQNGPLGYSRANSLARRKP